VLIGSDADLSVNAIVAWELANPDLDPA